MSHLKKAAQNARNTITEIVTTASAIVATPADKLQLTVMEPNYQEPGRYKRAAHRAFLGYKRTGNEWRYEGFYATDESGFLYYCNTLTAAGPSGFQNNYLFEKVGDRYKYLHDVRFKIGERYLFIPFALRLLFSEPHKYADERHAEKSRINNNWFSYIGKTPDDWLANTLKNESVNFVSWDCSDKRLYTGTTLVVGESNLLCMVPTFCEYLEKLYLLLKYFNDLQIFHDNIVRYDETNVTQLRTASSIIELARSYPQTPQSEIKTNGLSIAAFFESIRGESNSETLDNRLQQTAYLLADFALKIEKKYITDTKVKSQREERLRGYNAGMNSCCEAIQQILTSDVFGNSIDMLTECVNSEDTEQQKNDLENFSPGFTWLRNGIESKIITEAYIALSRWPDHLRSEAFYEIHVKPYETRLAYSLDLNDLKILKTLFCKDELKASYPFLEHSKSFDELIHETKIWFAEKPQPGSTDDGLIRAGKNALDAFAMSPFRGVFESLEVILNAFVFTGENDIDNLRESWVFARKFRSNLALGRKFSGTPSKPPSPKIIQRQLGLGRTKSVENWLRGQINIDRKYQTPGLMEGMLSAYSMYSALAGLKKIVDEVQRENRQPTFKEIRNGFVCVQSFGASVTGLLGTRLNRIPFGGVFGTTFTNVLGPLANINSLWDHAISSINGVRKDNYEAAVLDALKGGVTALQLAESLRASYVMFRVWQQQQIILKKATHALGRKVSRKLAKETARRVVATKFASASISAAGALGGINVAMWVYILVKAGQEWVLNSYKELYRPFGTVAQIIEQVNESVTKNQNFSFCFSPKSPQDYSEDKRYTLRRERYDFSDIRGRTFGNFREYVGDGIEWSSAVRFLTGKGQHSVFPSLESMASIMRNLETEPAAWALREMGVLPFGAIATILGKSKDELHGIYENGISEDQRAIAGHLDPKRKGEKINENVHKETLKSILEIEI
ncbi:hypothetical protein QA601_00345 [Chitinispirillales bacterium ANBcel5]|uniref:hypothetical protein n=1 Tax=Cellulosispirillum alkaliphilum TaxID=3039283 RepID=UPI002A517C0F|nr:hypothetical protein [Chitinispirillales bacterium ANBcel5]